MNTNISLLKPVYMLLAACLMSTVCVAGDKNRLPDPKIRAGIAKITGHISGYQHNEGEEYPAIDLFVPVFLPDPSVTDTKLYHARLQKDGNFIFDVPVELDPTLGFLYSASGLLDGLLGIPLMPGEETVVQIRRDESGDMKSQIKPSFPLTSYDMRNLKDGSFLNKFDLPRRNDSLYGRLYTLTPEEFVRYGMEEIKKRTDYALERMAFSQVAKHYLSSYFKLVYLKGALLTYTKYMERNRRNYDPKSPIILHEPGRSYYSFLKQFSLNDSQYFYSEKYSETLQTILSIDTLGIPPIGDTPVDQWQKEVKGRIADLVGFDSGLFYDILTANAYVRQFDEQLTPLSDVQKKNIGDYFTATANKDIAPILLARNEQIVHQTADNPHFQLTVCPTPNVPDDKLMESIVARYKGKVVLIDFWATWCGPCIGAMKDIRALKGELKDEDIVFVYLTNQTSPKKLWDSSIQSIGGYHYYLTAEQWSYLMDSFGFTGIPSYLVYDAQGNLQLKKTSYIGNTLMGDLLRSLLAKK